MEYNSVSFTAYLSASIVAALLTFTYCYQFFKRQPTYVFALAAAVHTINLLAIAFKFVHEEDYSPLALLAIECLHYNAWITSIALALKATTNHKHHLPVSLRILFTIGWLPTALVLGGWWFDFEPLLIFSPWFTLVLTVISLVSLEQLFHYLAANDRQIKVLCISLSALFLYDVYLYTHSLIFGTLDPLLWQSRAAVSMGTCLFMALAGLLLMQQHDRPAHFNLSRPIAFYTTSLIAVGALIGALTLGGYYVRLHGGNWGAMIYSFVLIAAVLQIATVFISSRVRSQLSVLINKHLFRHKYDYRNEWLGLINFLAQPVDNDQVNERAFYAVASITKAPGGAIWLRKQGFYEPVFQSGIPSFIDLQEEPMDSPFCQTFLESEWVFFPDSGSNEALSKHNELLPQWARNIPDLWLIFPLIVAEELVGFMALTKPATDTALTWEDLDMLKTMGRQLASYLKRHEQAEQLAEIRQFDTYNKLVAFIIHDLNNLIAQQALVVRNAERHKDNPAFIEDAIETISNSVNRMHNLLRKLRRDETDLIKRLNLKDVMEQALTECRRVSPTLIANVLDDDRTINADQIRLVMTITNFIKNAQEATPADGCVQVALRCSGNNATITIEDNGSGMDWEFIHNRLFKPFDTTKSGKGMGIGVYLSRGYISELGGTLNVISAVGEGTTITITLPINAKPNLQE